MSTTRRDVLTRLLVAATATAATALPVGHIAAAIPQTTPEPRMVAPGVELLDDAPPVVAGRAVFTTVHGEFEGGPWSELLWVTLSIDAHADGSGVLRLTNEVDTGIGQQGRIAEAVVPLDAAAFRPGWAAIFAKHYRITHAAELPRGFSCGHPVAPISIADAGRVEEQPYAVVYGANPEAKAAGFDMVVCTGRYPRTGRMEWYAVRLEPAEPHWPGWMDPARAA